MRYWEDFTVGEVFELGSTEVTADAIVEYAKQWDPQPYHLDEEEAKNTPFGGLIASGWHTASMFMKLYVDGLLIDTSCQGGVGVERLQWLKPVRPGDTLTARVTVEAVIPSTSRPQRGTVRFTWEMLNQDADVVLRMHAMNLFGRRTPG